MRCFLDISFPTQDILGDRRSAGLREPGLLQQLLQMRERDSNCRGFRFKSNKIIKAIHKIKIMIMIMLRNVKTVCSSIRCLRWRTLCTTTVFTCELSSADQHYHHRRNFSEKGITMIIIHILTTTDVFTYMQAFLIQVAKLLLSWKWSNKHNHYAYYPHDNYNQVASKLWSATRRQKPRAVTWWALPHFEPDN